MPEKTSSIYTEPTSVMKCSMLQIVLNVRLPYSHVTKNTYLISLTNGLMQMWVNSSVFVHIIAFVSRATFVNEYKIKCARNVSATNKAQNNGNNDRKKLTFPSSVLLFHEQGVLLLLLLSSTYSPYSLSSLHMHTSCRLVCAHKQKACARL